MAEDNWAETNIGHQIDSTTVRLDLYRLTCIFEASQPMASRSYDGPLCVPLNMLRNYERDEISRLIISVSIFCRLIDDNFQRMVELKVLEPPQEYIDWLQAGVGWVTPNINEKLKTVLSLRDACNCILHAKKMNFDVQTGTTVKDTYLRPFLYIYGSHRKKNWRAHIEMHDFIDRAYQLSVHTPAK